MVWWDAERALGGVTLQCGSKAGREVSSPARLPVVSSNHLTTSSIRPYGGPRLVPTGRTGYADAHEQPRTGRRPDRRGAPAPPGDLPDGRGDHRPATGVRAGHQAGGRPRHPLRAGRRPARPPGRADLASGGALARRPRRADQRLQSPRRPVRDQGRTARSDQPRGGVTMTESFEDAPLRHVTSEVWAVAADDAGIW